jgi:hypothetical protein
VTGVGAAIGAGGRLGPAGNVKSGLGGGRKVGICGLDIWGAY